MDPILNIVQWNAQSIVSNRHVLTNFLYDYNIHVAIISETWLKPNRQFNIRGYNIERNDTGNTHNGVAILIRNSFVYSRVTTAFDDSLQNICVRVVVGSKELSIVSFYSPSRCRPPFNKNKLDALIKSIPSPMIFAGDFNAYHTSWGCDTTCPRGRDVLEVIDDNNLVLLNDGQYTTVGSLTWRQNALDLSIVSSSLALSCDWSVHDDPLGSYHLPVIINVVLNNNNSYDGCSRANLAHFPIFPNYKFVDWKVYQDKVESLLEGFQIQSFTPLEAYSLFCKILHSAVESSIPAKRISSNSTSPNRKLGKKPSLPWWNNKCSEAVQKSKLAYIQFKNNPSESTYLEFKRLQAYKKLTLKIERANSWAALCGSFHRCTPLSIIWKYMRKFNKTFVPNNSNDDRWVLDFLKKYTPDYVSSNIIFPHQDSEINSSNSFLLHPFTLQELKSAVSSRKESAFGLDGIPYKMFKALNENSMIFFLNLLNYLWANNEIPPCWKTDCLVPILKPDKPRLNKDSYRPIALTSCAGKIFEQLLKQRLEFYVEKNNILPSNQFGFRRGRSSRESICQLHLDIQNSVVHSNATVCVFFDIAGAFNSVNVDILSNELISIGLPQKFVQWINKFLSERKVFVKYNGSLYGPRCASVGVCQGGILSPLIFILYIRRLNMILGSNVKNLQFADDLVVYACGSNLSNLVNHINNALRSLSQYFSYLNLDINPLKSKLLVFGKNNSLMPNVYYNNTAIPVSLETKFLGVSITHNLSWRRYIDNLTVRANKAFNVLKSLASTYWGADPKILLLLYKSLIRSHFEYGFFCFAGDNRLVDILDKIQNKSMRLITGAFKSTPINVLQIECNLPPISIRFNYLKERFILKLFSIPHNQLLFNISTLLPSLVHKPLYIMRDLPRYIQYLQDFPIYKSLTSSLPCYEGDFQSKFPPIKIFIDNELSSKEEVYSKLSEWDDHRFLYTDGSKNDSSVSFAFFDSFLKRGMGYKLDKNASVFTAEAVAILAALEHIKYQNQGYNKWLILSDSMSVLKNLNNNKLHANTCYLIYAIKQAWYDLSLMNIIVNFMWVPSHIGVSGNEQADSLAKIINTTTSQTNSFNISLPYSDIIFNLKQRMCQKWISHWNYAVQVENKGLWYAPFNVKVNSLPWFCKNHTYINRKFYSIIMRLRFGHCRLNFHLYRLKMVNSSQCSHCNSYEETISHILFDCSSFGIQRLVLLDELINIYGSTDLVPRSITNLLVNSCTYIPLYKFILNTVGEI